MSLSRSEKISLGTKEIAKRIRGQVKEEFPACKFSVVSEYYSGGSSITVSLMEADRKIKRGFSEVSERAMRGYYSNRYTVEELKSAQERVYHQLGHFYDDYNADAWNNGVFLTYQGYMLLKRVEQIANFYNYDDSDSMTDYYSVNFSFSLYLGKWDKPFVDGAGFKADPKLEANVKRRLEQVKVDAAEEKVVEMLSDAEAQTPAFKEKLRLQHIEDIKRCSAVIDERGFVDLRNEEAKQLEIDRVALGGKFERYFPDKKPTDWRNFTLEL